MNNDIIKFYLNEDNSSETTYNDIKNADFSLLEKKHNWVQYAFPNFEPSECVSNTPVLTNEILSLFRTDSDLKQKVSILTLKYLNHLCDVYDDANIYMIPHNNRRVTRLLKFLKLLDENLFTVAKNKVFEIKNDWIGDKLSNPLYSNMIKLIEDATIYWNNIV